MKPLVLYAILISACCSLTAAIMFNLEPNTQKCLRDEMQAHQLVLGEYEITDAPGQKIDYVVRGPISYVYLYFLLDMKLLMCWQLFLNSLLDQRLERTYFITKGANK